MQKDDMRGRMIAQFFFDEVEKIAQSELQQNQPLVKEEQEDAPEEIIRSRKHEDVETPGQIFGTEIQKKKDGSVKAFPIIQSPPGYSFRPDLQGFVPDAQQQGWMTNRMEELASAKQDGYSQAKQEDALRRIKDEANTFVESRLQQPNMGMAQPMPQAPVPQAPVPQAVPKVPVTKTPKPPAV